MWTWWEIEIEIVSVSFGWGSVEGGEGGGSCVLVLESLGRRGRKMLICCFGEILDIGYLMGYIK